MSLDVKGALKSLRSIDIRVLEDAAFFTFRWNLKEETKNIRAGHPIEDYEHSREMRITKYNCPLCGQPVSASLYQKITGIWEERKKALAEIKEQRTKLLGKVAEQRKKLKKQAAEFRKNRKRLIKDAVNRQTKRLESKITILNRKQEEVKRIADKKIRTATERAHREAERLATTQLDSFKKDIRASVKAQVKKEREMAAHRAETKYEKVKQRLGSALDRVQIKDRQVRELREDIKELKEQLKKETTPQIEGLLYEEVLTRELHKRFPEDKVEHHGKGGDVLQYVIRNGEQAGVLVYECKRVKKYSSAYVGQASDAKEKRKADFAILVTKTMKKGAQGFYVERGVIVVHPAGVLSLAGVLRVQVIRIAEMKLGQLQRSKAAKLTLEYLEGPEFTNSMDAVIQESVALYKELMDEIEKHKAVWKRRYSSYRKICEDASTVKSTTQALLSGKPEYKKLIQTEYLPALPELLPVEKAKEPHATAQSTNRREHGVKDTHVSGDVSMKTSAESEHTE